MKKITPIIQTLICYLFIVLFVYAAVSKLIDFETFQTQLGQSPVISAYASIVSYGILIIELLISILLGIKKYQKLGLYCALFLMNVFTIYIIIILKFAPFTPCSCGGILEDMGWNEHLIFNLIFIILAILGIILMNSNYRITASKIGLIFLVGILFMIGLFQKSRFEKSYNNSFIREFLPHHSNQLSKLNLKQEGFTISGFDSCFVYLSHPSAPLYLLQYDYHTNKIDTLHLKIKKKELPYKRLITQVDYPTYVIGDGSIGILQIGQLNAKPTLLTYYQNIYYNSYALGNNHHIGFVAAEPQTRSNILGVIYPSEKTETIKLNKTSLKNQINGTFDTDGLLIWNKENNHFLYSYYYRNEVIVLDTMMNELYHLNSIDTITTAQIDMAYYAKTDQYKIGPRTIRVHEYSATYGDKLYIYSRRFGKYEEEISGTSIIDVYDYPSKSYLYSFYLYHLPQEKLRNFRVFKNHIVAVVDKELYFYELIK